MTFDPKPDLDNANVGITDDASFVGSYLMGSFLFICPFCVAIGGEIVVKINGTAADAAGKTILQYLAETSYDVSRIAVERNGEIVPKARYGETTLEDGDEVEVVSFVGGG